MDLHLYNYNNYYNRRIKPIDLNSGNPLGDMYEYELYVEADVNFNPNDGIMTTHTIGGVHTYSGNADYAIVANGGTIISCWFVLENKRIRGGQYEVLLKRDTVAEHLETILAAPCFIEKGWVPNTDPAIFNHENMDFNQIKKSEVLLKDKTQIPWLVGYYDKSKTMTVNVPRLSLDVDYTVNGLSNWDYYEYYSAPARLPVEYRLFCQYNTSGAVLSSAYIYIDGFTEKSTNLQVTTQSLDNLAQNYQYTIECENYGNPNIKPKVLEDLVAKMKTNSSRLFETANNAFTGFISKTEYEELAGLAESKIYDSTTKKLYKVGYSQELFDSDYTTTKKVDLTSTFGYEMYNIYSQIDGISGNRPTSNSSQTDFELSVRSSNVIQLTLTEIDYDSYSVTIAPEAAAQTASSPYNIFAIPYGEIYLGVPEGEGEYDYVKTSADLALRICMELIRLNSGGDTPILYDVQLLPYCPIPEIRNELEDTTRTIFLLDKIANTRYTPITDSDNVVNGAIFYCSQSGSKFNLDYSFTVGDIKTSNETEMCRLVSPNWNGVFEFSPAKNYGINGFTVDYELKPYTPYIHISPVWSRSGLYGKRDNDPIGLICGGDFGLTMVSDNWETYERQNKNYQNIFDRQIQNLEVQQQYQRVGDIVNTITGTASGAVGGAMTGAMVGGGYGAAAGAVIGGVGSLAGGIADASINEALRTEAMDYTKDLFGYQMGNIKALPQSLAKVNSFNPNNTIFPILEFYGCTEKEIAALQNKIIYNGMSIGRIGQLKDYLNPLANYTYVKGQIILLDGLEEDSHFATDIANEIYKGVRI